MAEPEKNRQLKATIDTDAAEGTSSNNSGAVSSNSSPTKEKLKTIVSRSPDGLVQLPTTTASISTPRHSYTRTYSSKIAPIISIDDKYQPLNQTTSNYTKPESKYQNSSNYSYQGRTLSPGTYRPSYIPRTESSHNSSFTREALTDRPHTTRYPSSYKYDYLRSSTKKASEESAQYPTNIVSESSRNQLTSMSTNTSINNNPSLPTNQVIQQT